MRKRVTFFMVSLFFLSATQAQTAIQLIELGGRLSEEGRYDSAIVLLNRAAEIDTTIYRLYTERGMAYYNLNKMRESYTDLSKAVERWPDSAQGFYCRALLYSKALYTEEAIADNTKALDLASTDSLRKSIYMSRGVAYAQQRKFQLAYEDFTKCYLFDTLSLDIINNLALTLGELGRGEDGIAYFRKIISIDSSFVGAWGNLGFQYLKLKKFKEAIVYFDRELLLEGNASPLTLNNRGFAKYSLKDYKGALVDINKSIIAYATNSYAYRNRALVYLANNEKEKACIDLQKALELQFTIQYGNEVQELHDLHCAEKK